MNNTVKKMKDWLWGEPSEVDGSASVNPYGGLGHVVNPTEPEKLITMTTIVPHSFNDARKIGEAFRDGLTTVVNLTQLPEADSRRIVDFFSGVVFALDGQIERVDQKIFILTPSFVDVVTDGSAGTASTTDFYNHS